MVVAALVDLGVPPGVVIDAVAALALPGVSVRFGVRRHHSLAGSTYVVEEPRDADGRPTSPPRDYAEIRRLLAAAPLDADVRARAEATFARLAKAEAKVHRTHIDQVHFHEVGGVDALADIVGAAAALAWLAADVMVSSLPLGRGMARSAHGALPLPPPAVVECLAGFPTYDGGRPFEFVTPTGAAIVAANARPVSGWPTITPTQVGFGAGTASLPDRPNLLRAVWGSSSRSERASEQERSAATHTLLETNLDDATGETLAHVVASLMSQGALDVWLTPILMKKGRPAHTLSVLARGGDAERLASAVLQETPSLGLRVTPVSRRELERESLEVKTRFGVVPVKVASTPQGRRVKPEFDVCVRLATEHGVAVRVVQEEAQFAARTTL
jgi:hypothetical protein